MNYPKDFYDIKFTERYYQAEPWEVAEERFRKRFQLHVEKSKRHYRHKPVPVSYRSWSEANIPFEHEVTKEPLLKVYISDEHYEQLIKREQQMEELDRENNRFRKMELATLDEMAVRGNNPAVQKAYEKYRMLLELVREPKK